MGTKTRLKMKLAVFALLLVVLPVRASSYVCDTLIVEVIKGKYLVGDTLNPPDPYVKVKVDGQTKKTVIRHNMHEPVWNKELKFTNVKSDKLVMDVWEYDNFLNGGDDHLKTCEEKIMLGSYSFYCRTEGRGVVLYGYHCLKGNMKKGSLIRKIGW